MSGIEIALLVTLVLAIVGGILLCRRIDAKWAVINLADRAEYVRQLERERGQMNVDRNMAIDGYTTAANETLKAELAESTKDLEAAQAALRIATEAKQDWERNYAEVCKKQDELRLVIERERERANRFSPEQVRTLEAIAFILETTAPHWTATDARWLKLNFASGHGFKFRQLVQNTANNFMIHAVGNPAEGTREWRAGCAMGFRSLLSILELYEKEEQFGETDPALEALAKDRNPAPNGVSTAAMDRARFTP